MTDHHQLSFLGQGVNTVAYYCLEEPKNLLVFVHGFGGASVETWKGFEAHIRNEDIFKNCDAIFYGYPSRKQQANASANVLYEDLQSFTIPFPQGLSLERELPQNFKYKNIVLLGHSLGAVIIRRALITAFRANDNWATDCKLLLFAPAHRGAHLHRLVFNCLPDAFKFVGSIAEFIYPVLKDLDEHSSTMQDLKTDTEKILKKGKHGFVIADTILTSPADKVIIWGDFCQDPGPKNAKLHNRYHTSVCKPVFEFSRPIEILQALINKLS